VAAAAHAVAGASVARRDPPWLRALLISITLLFLGLFLFLPLLTVFLEAFRKGVQAYFASFADPDARSAIMLTLITAGISVPCNLVFGLVASWAIAKFCHADRLALLGLAGGLGPDLCADVRNAGLVRSMAQ
jgi:sulfate/thiosulfate transport system permease protein